MASPYTVVNNVGQNDRGGGRASVPYGKSVKGVGREIRGGEGTSNNFPQCRADKVVGKGIFLLMVLWCGVEMGTTKNTIQN